MNINEHEKKVLTFLADQGGEYGYLFYGFATLMAETGLDRKTVRRACRSLTRKNLAAFASGLWNDDGEPGGSGYGATEAGAKFAEDFPRKCDGCGTNDADPPGNLCPGCEAYAEHQR